MQDEQKPGWTFNPGQSSVQPPAQPQNTQREPQSQATPQTNDGAINWTASEFVEHEKNFAWYVGFLFIAIVGIGIIYLITRDLFSVVVLGLFAIAFIIFAARKPKVLNYSVNESGIHIGEKFYAFGQFKSYAVIDEGVIRSISLMPLKRFMPALNLYFAPDDEHKITEFIGSFLPREERKQDAIDRLMHKIRF